MWPVMKVAGNERGLWWTCCYERGLLWTCLQWMSSV